MKDSKRWTVAHVKTSKPANHFTHFPRLFARAKMAGPLEGDNGTDGTQLGIDLETSTNKISAADRKKGKNLMPPGI